MEDAWNVQRLAAVCLLALLLMPVVAEAQEHPRNRVTIAAGVTSLSHQDLIHTPFVHGGVSPRGLGIRYERAAPWVQFAEASYLVLNSRLAEAYPILFDDHAHASLPHTYHVVDAAYGLGRNLRTTGNEQMALGAALRLDLQATDYNYGFEPNFGYFISPSLNVWYRHELTLSSKQRLAGRAMVPLVSWVARSPYLVNDDQFIENIESGRPLTILAAFLADGEPAGWDRLQRFDLSIDYHFTLVRRWNAGASYRFGLLKHSEPRPLTAVRNSIELSTSIGF
jgi:hypothetical protein